MKLAALLVLLAATGCRLTSNKWAGTRPRASNDVSIALEGDADGTALAGKVLTADPRVHLVQIDRQKYPQEGCTVAREHGADYYAVASMNTHFERNTKCVKYSSSSFWDPKGHEECAKEVTTSEGATAQFDLEVYDAITCDRATALSQEVSHYVPGGDEQGTKTEAAETVQEAAPHKFIGFPDQAAIGADGHIQAAAGDGEYAMYRQRKFAGTVKLHDSGTPSERLQMLMCCEKPEPGDQLVRRGEMTMIEVLASVDGAMVQQSGSNVGAFGVGAHLRHYHLAGGLELGASAEVFGTSKDLTFTPYSAEGGWDFRLGPSLHLTPALAVGLERAIEKVMDMHPTAWKPFATPQIRLLSEIYWFAAGLDLGYTIAPKITAWNGIEGAAPPAHLRGPLARFYVAIQF